GGGGEGRGPGGGPREQRGVDCVEDRRQPAAAEPALIRTRDCLHASRWPTRGGCTLRGAQRMGQLISAASDHFAMFPQSASETCFACCGRLIEERADLADCRRRRTEHPADVLRNPGAGVRDGPRKPCQVVERCQRGGQIWKWSNWHLSYAWIERRRERSGRGTERLALLLC